MTLKRGESRYKGAWQTFEHASAIDVSCHIDRENQQLVCLGVALDFRAKMHGLRSMSCQDVTWRAKWNFGFCLAFRMLSEDCNSVSLDRKPGRRCDFRGDHKRVRILFVRASKGVRYSVDTLTATPTFRGLGASPPESANIRYSPYGGVLFIISGNLVHGVAGDGGVGGKCMQGAYESQPRFTSSMSRSHSVI